MGSTTAPIAGKLATFASPKAMSADSVRIDCVFHDDPRLIEAVPLIVSHAARAAGIAEKEAAALAHQILEACRKVFSATPHAPAEAGVRLLADQFHDRVEIALEFPGAPAALEKLGRDAASGHPPADRIELQSIQGRSRLVFTKYCVAVDSNKLE